MDKTKLLFCCTANRLRSRTAFEHFGKSEKYIVDSCGLGKSSVTATQRSHWPDAKLFNKHLYDEADIVFCMELEHAEEIKRRSKDGNWDLDLTKIRVLNIPDIYALNDPQLIDLLEAKVNLALEQLPSNFQSLPENIQQIFGFIPLSVKIRSIVKQNDLKNWVDGKYVGDEKQLENTVKALEFVVNQHFKK